VVAARRDRRTPGPRSRDADRAGVGCQPLRVRSGGAVGGGPPAAREQGPQHAVRRPHAHRQGATHRAPRTGHGRRRRAHVSARRVDGVLVLADGEEFEGTLAGATDEIAVGEVVFNTSLSGYQEILTDPSYAGQMITFTYPHIGNYGVNDDDFESARPFCRGAIVRDLVRRPRNWRTSGG